MYTKKYEPFAYTVQCTQCSVTKFFTLSYTQLQLYMLYLVYSLSILNDVYITVPGFEGGTMYVCCKKLVA